jgi:hypothetical protein
MMTKANESWLHEVVRELVAIGWSRNDAENATRVEPGFFADAQAQGDTPFDAAVSYDESLQ